MKPVLFISFIALMSFIPGLAQEKPPQGMLYSVLSIYPANSAAQTYIRIGFHQKAPLCKLSKQLACFEHYRNLLEVSQKKGTPIRVVFAKGSDDIIKVIPASEAEISEWKRKGRS
jgi:hypothetical protein